MKSDLDIPNRGITIEFAKSTSGSFSKILDLAKLAPSFQQCKRKSLMWYCATWPNNQMIDVEELAYCLDRLSRKKVYIDGEELPWNKVFGFLRCTEFKYRAWRFNTYCYDLNSEDLNIWGCLNAEMSWAEWEDWWAFGHFKDNNTYAFDKERIWQELKRKLSEFRFCPYLNLNYVKTVFELFPDHVEVKNSGPWDYRECDENDPNADVKITIKNTSSKDYSDQSEISVDGVTPKNSKEALKMINIARKQCGLKPFRFWEKRKFFIF
jgi:hypothetical protein